MSNENKNHYHSFEIVELDKSRNKITTMETLGSEEFISNKGQACFNDFFIVIVFVVIYMLFSFHILPIYLY